MQLAVAGEMGERVDVCTDVAAERDRVRGRRVPRGTHQIAVPLGEAE